MTTVTLADVARSLKLNPKVARAKVRRAKGNGLPRPVAKGTYEYPATAKRAVVAFLKAA